MKRWLSYVSIGPGRWEGVSVLKRGINGTYQHVGSNHLHRYVNEFAFRYNHRASLEINDKQEVIWEPREYPLRAAIPERIGCFNR